MAVDPMRSEWLIRWAFRLGFGLVVFLSVYILVRA
jgi:hypothetical protein